jgi:hypothetical protein
MLACSREEESGEIEKNVVLGERTAGRHVSNTTTYVISHQGFRVERSNRLEGEAAGPWSAK